MTSREVAAAGAVGLVGIVGFAVGLVASSDVLVAVAVAAAATGYGLLGIAVVVLQRLRQGMHRQELAERARLQVAHKQLQRTRELVRAQRRTVQVVRNQGAKVQQRVGGLANQVAALQAEVTAIRTPPLPRVTGVDLSTPGAKALDELAFDGPEPSVVLLLHSFGSDVMFAGIRTAAMAAVELAGLLRRPMRVVVFDNIAGDVSAATEALANLIRTESRHPEVADGLQLSAPGARNAAGHHVDDVWVATFWTTAWSLARLAENGKIRTHNVVYLVQDWEPGFYPWGDLQLKALSTYNAGFGLLVNSRSLARYVEQRTGRPVDPARVFAPELDPRPLHAAADRWKPAPRGTLRVLFYARPNKPRNMLNLGVQALRLWAKTLPPTADVVVRLAGEPIGAADLGPILDAEPLGKLTYDAYYDVLADTDIGLALMSSPHPGHLALELPMAGIPTVTNPFEDCRESWIDGLVVAERPDERALAEALAVAADRASGLTSHAPTTIGRDLGGSLADAVAVVARGLQQREW